jgi:GTP-binding protein Era
LILNKIDKLTKEQIMNKIQEYMDLYPFQEIIPVSALKDDNLDTLLKVIKSYLKEGICYYGKEDVTNQSTEFVLAEMIREKVFRLTEEEIPHSVACIIESVEKKKNSVTIYANIITDRDSVKRIIVGANGQMIKKIGTYAREDMEEMLGKKVYLNLFVKVIKNWRDKEKYLKEFGYQDFD